VALPSHVCHLTTTFNSRSGSARRISRIVEALVDRGVRVTLIVGSANDLEKFPLPGCEVVVVDSLVKPVSPLRDAVSLFAVWKVLRRLRPDVVHTHLAKGGVLGRLAAAFFQPSSPSIIHTVHGPTWVPGRGGIGNRIYFFLERVTARLSQGLVFVGDDLRRAYVEAGIVDGDKACTIYTAKPRSFLDCSHRVTPFMVRRLRVSFPPGKHVLAVVARLVPSKRVDHAIRLLARLRNHGVDAALVVVGEALVQDEMKHEKSLRELVARLGLTENVAFLGFRRDVCELLSSVDCVVSTSGFEGLSNVLVESMLAGTPLVGYEVFGMREILGGSRLTFSVAQGDLDGLERLVVEVLSRLPEYSDEVERLRSAFGERFTSKKMVDDTLALYASLQ